ncbi:hypothetical protein AB1Y20_005559 [Prymnesium parvum]|uniref:Plastid lipid-associated protein/fibrillin conserved domain-containing protein n=1 Tax=Prymnesium parvum TaxID=97485 RepID=A0AB34J4N2_PRYPA
MHSLAPSLTFLLALASLGRSGCDGLAIALLRTPAPPRHAPLLRTAVVVMQAEDVDDEPTTPAEADASADPAVESAVSDTPSDVDDMPFNVPELEDIVADDASIAKDALKAEVSQGLSSRSKPDRAVIGEILLALEAQNPTRSPATSPLLNGKWKFVYASGASPGLKALQLLLKSSSSAPKSPSGADLIDVQDTYLTITPDQPRAKASVQVRLLSFENTLTLASKLEAESAVRLCETYQYSESEYMSLRLPFQSPIEYKRSVLVSYLDDEVLVIRDSAGRPDILMRCEGVEWASSSIGSEPGSYGSAPGAS